LSAESPSRLEDLRAGEDRVMAITVKKHKEQLAMMEWLLKLYRDGLQTLGSFDPNGRLEGVLLLLATRSFRSLCCEYQLIPRGYYSQAVMLARSVREDFFTAAHCINKPESVEALLNDQRMPSYRQMADSLGKVAGELTYYTYRNESQHAHARMASLWLNIDPNSGILNTDGYYVERLFSLCYHAFMGPGSVMLGILAMALKMEIKAQPSRERLEAIMGFLTAKEGFLVAVKNNRE
jgi:hypothetical protein